MVNRSNRCTSVLTASRTSSCTDYVCNCCPRSCINACYRDQCELINDRTYTTLRKICHKIFKDYNRAQCREKYTIFDGGNSINVRIHRSGSQDDGNNKDQRYEQSNEDRYRLHNKNIDGIGQDTRRDKLTQKKTGRDFEKFNVSNREKTIRGKSKEAGEEVKDNYVRRNQKSKGAKSREGELNEYEENDYDTKFKGKEKFGKKGKINDDLDIKEQRGENLRTKKKGESSRVNKRNFRDGSESDENDNGKGKLRSRDSKNDGKKSGVPKKGDPNFKNRELIAADTDNTKSGKGKNKYMEYKDDDEYVERVKYGKGKNKYKKYVDDDTDIASDDDYAQKGKYRKGKKAKDNNFENSTRNANKRSSRKSKNHNTNYETRTSKDIRQKRYHKSQDFDDVGRSKGRNYRVITNLRSKVRRGDSVGLNNESSLNHIRNLQRLMIQKAGSLQYRRTKPSRADEVKACDYLRALMEQRDLCQLSCAQQSNEFGPHICIPQTCIPSCCTKTAISCFPKTCEC